MLEIKKEKENTNILDRINGIFETAEEDTSILEKYTKGNKKQKELKYQTKTW